MKILTLDLETSPNTAHVWGLFKQNVSLAQLRESTRMMCFAAKWYGEDEVFFYSEFHDGTAEMVRAAHNLIGESDAVVHFNGTSFDMPHLRREFQEQGLGAHKPVREIDLLRVVQKKFRLTSNKLEYVAKWLDVEEKFKNSGFELWTRCMAGDQAAWDEMRTYNVQDIRTTEQVFDKLRPWIHNMPNPALYSDQFDPDVVRCTNCGSDRFQKRGFAYTDQSKFQQYRCAEGHWFRGTKAVARTHLRGVA